MKRSSSLHEFKNTTLRSADNNMFEALDRLAKGIMSEDARRAFIAEMEAFQALFRRFLHEKETRTEMDWGKVQSPSRGQLVEYESLGGVEREAARELLGKLVVVKLNGGLGTTMGCTGAKSLIEVREDATFLDLTVRQLAHMQETYGVSVPLVLMNSFNTERETAEVLQKYAHTKVRILAFRQKQFPRIDKDSLAPIVRSADPLVLDKAEWYPPGHGDVYDALYRSDLWATLRGEGREYVFISNIDNLGATVDVGLLAYMHAQKLQFCMEVTDKTRADVKGGTLINYEGKVRLLELAQVPKAHVEEFKSIKKFKIFNTNNMWISMSALESHLDHLNALDIIINTKQHRGRSVVQLETAAGAAIQHFERACGIRVPRSRFLPVKSTSDLMIVQSNLYSVQKGALIMNPLRIERMGEASVPLVKLGENYKTVSEYQARVRSIPDMLELDHLTVSGDVTFGANVTLRGTVIVVANVGDHIDLPDHATLENKVITGNLRILDH